MLIHCTENAHSFQFRAHGHIFVVNGVAQNLFLQDDIMPAENKGEFLKSSNVDLARALDLEICSQSDVFVPAIAGLFSGHVTGKRIPSGRTQILVPAPRSSASARDFISTYVLKKSHLAYKCYC
jgi:hypothetical protein